MAIRIVWLSVFRISNHEWDKLRDGFLSSRSTAAKIDEEKYEEDEGREATYNCTNNKPDYGIFG